MISLILAAALSLAAPGTEAQVVSQCQPYFAGKSFDGPFEVYPVADGLCLNGTIAKGDEDIFLTALGTFAENKPVVLVARSSGGDANVTLAMAEAISDRPVTVVAYDICASSCANYLLSAGKRKVVWQEAILAYHGGVSWDHLDVIVSAITEQMPSMGATEPDMADKINHLILQNIEENRQQLGELIARQDHFLVSVGISPTLFRWMDLYNHMLPQEQQSHCVSDPHMFVYPPALLARFNLRIDQYEGPDSQAALDAALAAKGMPTALCYWRE